MALRETEDPDELAARLEAAALDDIETGAEATLDLEMLEDRLRLLSSIRMNAQGLARYWRRRQEARRAGAGRRELADRGQTLRRVVGAHIVPHDPAELLWPPPARRPARSKMSPFTYQSRSVYPSATSSRVFARPRNASASANRP